MMSDEGSSERPGVGGAEVNTEADTSVDQDADQHTDASAWMDVAAAREVLRSCVCSRTRMLDRLLTQLYDDALAPIGLRANQLTVVSLVASMDGLRAVDVSRYLEMDKSTVSRGLALLREKGWLEEGRLAARGPKTLALTREGSSILSRAMPHWRQAGEEAEHLLGETSVETLRCAADAFLIRRARA